MIYLLDANTFIEAKNRHYRMQSFPGFWQWLLAPKSSIIIQSIRPIYDEITRNKSDPDELALWARENKSFFISHASKETQSIFAEIANYIENGNFGQIHKTRFLSGADPWLIAVAKMKKANVVTHEVSVGADSKKIKLPNIAQAFDVACLDIFDLLQASGCKFVLKD